MLYLYVYFAIFCIVTFALFSIDKKKAQNGLFRIPEYLLMEMSALGGALGAFLAMHIFHHKTQKPKFKYGIPLFLTIHIIIVLFIIL